MIWIAFRIANALTIKKEHLFGSIFLFGIIIDSLITELD